MPTTTRLPSDTHEEVLLHRDEASGLELIVAIHDSTLGPAVGGTRMLPYATTEDALADVLRLSAAMTFKAAAADLAFGGGKAVIIGDPGRDKSAELLYAFGRFIESLGGRFLTGEDMGTTAEDMRLAARESRYMIFPPSDDPQGDWQTSTLTALGVYRGIHAAVHEALGADSIAGLTVLVQGAGKVGADLVRMLSKEGAKILLSDVVPARCAEVAASCEVTIVEPTRIFESAAEVFAPCAIGGVLDEEVAARLRCKIVAGAANNQLQSERASWVLWERGVLYAPDYVINAGGLISALYEMGQWSRQAVIEHTECIYERLLQIFARARAEHVPPLVAADQLVNAKLERARLG